MAGPGIARASVILSTDQTALDKGLNSAKDKLGKLRKTAAQQLDKGGGGSSGGGMFSGLGSGLGSSLGEIGKLAGAGLVAGLAAGIATKGIDVVGSALTSVVSKAMDRMG